MELLHFLQAVNSILKMAKELMAPFVSDQIFHFHHLKLIVSLGTTHQ